jgi:hypothetical protein
MNTNSAGSYSSGSTNYLVGAKSPSFSMNTIDTSAVTPSPDTTAVGMFSNISWVTWLVLIFVLAFLGVNIFMYLAKGTQYITDTFKPILSVFGSTFGNLLGDTTKQVVNTSATGATAGINATANVITGGINAVQGAPATNTLPVTPVSTGPQQQESAQSASLNTALNSASAPTSQSTYQADDSYSSIQSSNSGGKAGWCYIGEERGIRSCSQVGVNDTCMSGDIFPTNEVCVNPNLRP